MLLVLIGQAGDRDDESIRALARAAWELRPDRVVIKTMEDYARGRAPKEVSALIEAELLRLGANAEVLVRSATELDGVRAALVWVRAGDLLVLPLHSQRTEVLSLLEKLSGAGWTPGASLPTR